MSEEESLPRSQENGPKIKETQGSRIGGKRLIFNKIYCAEKNARSVKLRLAGKEIVTPLYFPSVSSVNTTHNISSLVKTIIGIRYPFMLVSAYDFFNIYSGNPHLARSINNYSRNGNVLFVDSGGFESFWHKDEKWSYEAYAQTVKEIQCDIYTSYDPTLSLPEEVDDDSIVNSIIKSGSILETSQFIPIFHAKKPSRLVEIVKAFLRKYPYATQFVAVPERELGITIFERANTILKLREEIDTTGNKQLLHVLGCGNPLSMTLYCYCGADSFDSTDWMRATFDGRNLSLIDFSYLELIDCKCPVCSKTSHIYGKVFLHNLKMYDSYIATLHDQIKNDKLLDFINEKIGTNIIDRLGRS